jgi:hypothetical protein
MLQVAYNFSQQELKALRDATLEACQSVEDGDVQAGSSMASRLRALGGHVTRRMRGALRLGFQKTLSVVQSHYRINLGALSTGYIVPDGLGDVGAEAEMNRVGELRPCRRHPHRRLHGDSLSRRSSRQPPRALRVVGHSSPLDFS